MDSALLLVGSVPLDTPVEVFESFGAALGARLAGRTPHPDGAPPQPRVLRRRSHTRDGVGHRQRRLGIRHPPSGEVSKTAGPGLVHQLFLHPADDRRGDLVGGLAWRAAHVVAFRIDSR